MNKDAIHDCSPYKASVYSKQLGNDECQEDTRAAQFKKFCRKIK